MPFDALKTSGRHRPLHSDGALIPEPPAPVLDDAARALIADIARSRAEEDTAAAAREAHLRRLEEDGAAHETADPSDRYAFFEVGDAVSRDRYADYRVWECVPALMKRFKALGTPDDRAEALLRDLHGRAAPLLRAAAASYEFASGLKAARRVAIEAVVRRCLDVSYEALRGDEAVLRAHVTKLQKQLLRHRVPPAKLAVVPRWCRRYTTERGPKFGAPLPVQRAALRVQLDELLNAEARRSGALPAVSPIKKPRPRPRPERRRDAPPPRAFRDLPPNPYHEIWDHCDETPIRQRQPSVDFPLEGPWLRADEAASLSRASWESTSPPKAATWYVKDAAPRLEGAGPGFLACF